MRCNIDALIWFQLTHRFADPDISTLKLTGSLGWIADLRTSYRGNIGSKVKTPHVYAAFLL